MKNLLTIPKKMAEDIVKLGGIPIFVDNASTYPPLLKYYDKCPHEVIRLDKNYGHTVIWNKDLNILGTLNRGEWYAAGDPDFDISELPLNTYDILKRGISLFDVPKCGLSIKIDDIPDDYCMKETVLGWETPFYANELYEGYYGAPIDTSFAVYRPDVREHAVGGVRSPKYTAARHIPFYLTLETMNDEWLYYFENADPNVSSAARYLKPMIDEYKRAQGLML